MTTATAPPGDTTPPRDIGTPHRLARRARHFVAFARLQTLSGFAYRGNYLFSLIGLLLQIWLLRLVWTAVYDDAGAGATGAVNGIDLRTQIAYSTLAMVQLWVFNPWSFSSVPDRVRDGKVAVDLARPTRFLDQSVAAQIGVTVGLLPVGVLVLPVAILAGGARAPASLGAGFLYAVSLLLGFGILVLLGVIVGMTTFWTMEVGGFFMVYRMVSQFLAGGLVPLWFMPDWLRTITELLPFQTTTYTPLAIYLGRIEGSELVGALGLQLFWLLACWLLLRLIWSRALHRVVIQGG